MLTYPSSSSVLMECLFQVGNGKIQHPKSDFGDLKSLSFTDLNAYGDLVVSTRVRLGRTVEGFGFGPTLTKDTRIELENKVSSVRITSYAYKIRNFKA